MSRKRFAPSIALFALCLLPSVAQEQQRRAPVRERVYIGMVVRDYSASQDGMRVLSVAPESPAYKAGVRPGDVVLRAGGEAIRDRDTLRRIVRNNARGQVIPVELLRGAERLVLQVLPEARPDASPSHQIVVAPLGVDGNIYPITLPDEIRRKIRHHRRALREQLASLPDGLVPSQVTRELQAIRNLARDAQSGLPGWMSGRAGEISVRFRDEEGSLVLYGASNCLFLELYNIRGQLISRFELNTQAERRALPGPVLERKGRLRKLIRELY